MLYIPQFTQVTLFLDHVFCTLASSNLSLLMKFLAMIFEGMFFYSELLIIAFIKKEQNHRWHLLKRYTNADLKIFLHVCVHMTITP